MPNRFSNRKRKIQSVIKHKRISTQIQNDSPTDLEPGFIPNAAQPRTDRWQEMCGHVRPGDAKFRFCSKIKAQKGFFRNKILQRNLRDVHPEKLKRSKMSLREKQRYYQEKSHMENSDTYQNQNIIVLQQTLATIVLSLLLLFGENNVLNFHLRNSFSCLYFYRS